MEALYYKVNPGGNITAVVKGKFSQEQKIKLAKQILAEDTEIEQVGFWVDAKGKKAAGRLEMAGEEFCGNASRCLGYLLSQKEQKSSFFIEVSGWPDPIEVNTGDGWSEIVLRKDRFSLRGDSITPIVAMPGITHILTEKETTKESASRMLGDRGLLNEQAAGVINMKEVGNIIKINPIVWVRETQTFYEETACGSGSLAGAYFLNRAKGMSVIAIKQPSGSIYETQVTRDHLTLKGPIIKVVEESIQVPGV